MPSSSPNFDLPGDALVVDLHLHSSVSDGSDAPAGVMRRAEAAGLRVVSLTDHDTVAGLAEGRAEAGRLGLEFVDGIELSTSHGGRLVHVLGHFVRPEDPALDEQIRFYRENRRTRMAGMIERLNGLGVEVDAEDFFREYGGAVSVTRAHLSSYLMDRRLIARREEAFAKYLGEGAPAYVALDMISTARAVELIVRAGGAATLAHPNLSESDEIIPDLVSAGLAGIEVDHPSQDEEARSHYRALAKRYGLVGMGGSDCHGSRHGPERMGQHRQSVRSFLALREHAGAAR